MSGPALSQRHAHHAIHESAYGEAEELTEMLDTLVKDGDYSKAAMLVPVLVEHWRTRTLAHAGEEEAGLYQEVLKQRPEAFALIQSLQRDHQLLHLLVQEIEELLPNLEQVDVFGEILARCKTLLWINQIHSRTEETSLLAL